MSRNLSIDNTDPWSNNPNAPVENYAGYLVEKFSLGGAFVGAIFYGIVVALFFQCMTALLSPVGRTRDGIRWTLVIHAIAMFSLVTIYTGYYLVSEYDSLPWLPEGNQSSLTEHIHFVADCVLQLNQWLADGLLLYRIYVLYSANYWVVGFPFLVYLSSLVTGFLVILQTINDFFGGIPRILFFKLGFPYYLISLSLNILLTLLIAGRLIFYSRNVRDATGAPTQTSRWCKAIVTLLVESCAFYALTYLMYIVFYSFPYYNALSWTSPTFIPILTQSQVIGPLLIVLRVANQTALTSESVTGVKSSIRFAALSQEQSGDSISTIPNENLRSSTDSRVVTPAGLVEDAVEEVPL